MRIKGDEIPSRGSHRTLRPNIIHYEPTLTVTAIKQRHNYTETWASSIINL
jgi:hypothetical protein